MWLRPFVQFSPRAVVGGRGASGARCTGRMKPREARKEEGVVGLVRVAKAAREAEREVLRLRRERWGSGTLGPREPRGNGPKPFKKCPRTVQ